MRVEVVYCCAQACTVKASAVARSPVISIAQTTAGRQWTRGVSTHQKSASDKYSGRTYLSHG